MDKRGSVAILTDEGMALLERTAPGHVETVRTTLFDKLTPEQVGQLEEICHRDRPGPAGRGRPVDAGRRPVAAPVVPALRVKPRHLNPLLQL